MVEISEMFVTKLRKIGNSYGVLIPASVIREEGLKTQDKVEVIIMKRTSRAIDRYFGIAKHFKEPFIRDKSLTPLNMQ